MKFIRELLFTLLIALLIFTGLQLSIKSFEVFNISMLPTFRAGDLIIVNKLAYALGGKPKTGDEIVFYAPNTGTKPVFDPFYTQHPSCFIKRVIAGPGDTVEIKSGIVYVNNKPLPEPYVNERPAYLLPERYIPANQYFVLGDNRNHSNDSHTGWLVPTNDIIGKVWFRYWTAQYPDIRLVMIPFFILIVGTLIVVMIADSRRHTQD